MRGLCITPRAYYCLKSIPAPSYVIPNPCYLVTRRQLGKLENSAAEMSNILLRQGCKAPGRNNLVQCVHNGSDYSPPRHDFICAVIASPKRYLNFIRFVLHLICEGSVVLYRRGGVLLLL